MHYTIYDGPRQLPDGSYYWAYAVWLNAPDQAANRGPVAKRTKAGIINCDLTNDHIAPQMRTTHTRLVVDRNGNLTRISDGVKVPMNEATGPASDYQSETVEVSIASQVEKLTLEYLGRAATRGERGDKTLPVDHSKDGEVEAYLERQRGGR